MKIAIIGKMCSGKSTIAEIIQDHDPQYEKFSFGQKVKDLAKELFNMIGKDRELLINFANKMRDIDPDVWVNQVLYQTKNKEFCIIDDIRYQNELDALIDDNWIIIKLTISKELQASRLKETYPETYKEHLKFVDHFSENEEFKFKSGYPHLILHVDNLTKEELKKEIIYFIEHNI